MTEELPPRCKHDVRGDCVWCELEILRTENAQLKADAERYRWLRPHIRAMSMDMGGQHRGYHLRSPANALRGPTLDAAIDAARTVVDENLTKENK